MKRVTCLLAASVSFSLSCLAVAGELSEEIRGAIRGAAIKDATISVSVRDAESDHELVAIDANRWMIPASNMKLLTSGAALLTLGPDFSFRTTLHLERPGEVAGQRPADRSAQVPLDEAPRLVLVADGDPAFADPDLLSKTSWTDSSGTRRVGMTADQLLGLWVDAVRAAGITTVQEVVVDDRVFDREFFHPQWPEAQRNQRSFAEVAGLNFQTNLLHFFPRPGKGPRPEIGDVRPRAPWIAVDNQATARSGKADKQTVWFARQPTRNAFVVKGNVKYSAVEPVEVPLHDVPAFVARLLAERLREKGITVGTARVAAKDEPKAVGEVIGPVIQTPLAAVLERCNTDSQNVYAESLLKRIGHATSGASGSWTNGAAAVRSALAARVGPKLAGNDLSGLVVSDGSGLSRQNRVTASLLTLWIGVFHRDAQLASTFIDSLAIGGESGTLRNRFGKLAGSGVSVQCKTGFINGVSCLSGVVTASDGRRRSFSVLGNNLVQGGAVAKAKKLQETIVELIAADLAARTVLGGD